MKKKVKISHLVVNGCSFTYCQGLEKPQVDGWPARLARKLGVPVVNLAAKGSGNDAILRRTYEYFFLNKPFNNHPFFITAWSFAVRREEFFDRYRGQVFRDFQTIDFKGENPLEKEVVYNYTTELGFKAAERKKLLYWCSAVQLFKANNIPYLTTDYLPNSREYTYTWLEVDHKEMYNEVYHDFYKMTNFSNYSSKYKHELLPCGHDGLSAQVEIADYAYDFLTERYELEIVEAPKILTIDEYRTMPELQHISNEWRPSYKSK